MSEKDYQSVNGYVYSKRRNTETLQSTGESEKEGRDIFNVPVSAQYPNGHYAIDIPLPEKAKKKYESIKDIFFAVPFLLTMGVMGILITLHLNDMITGVIIMMFILMPAGGAAGEPMSEMFKRRYLEKVCTESVTGDLVGYAIWRKKVKKRRGSGYSMFYAPKYEIFINGRYEIRTIHAFSREQKSPVRVKLLANADGYEIMFADKN